MKPEIRDVQQVVRDAGLASAYVVTKDGCGYAPARSQEWGQVTAFQRFKAAWLVFTGRADAVTYPGQP